MINPFVEQREARGSVWGICRANGNIHFPGREECIGVFERFVHFGFADDELRLFFLVERNEATLDCRLEVTVSWVFLVMEFRQIVDIERTIPD